MKVRTLNLNLSEMRAAVIIAIAVFLIVAVQANEQEAKFKSMTVRQLKTWMKQRDIPYEDITEKSEFITRAMDWMKQQQDNAPAKKELPADPFWVAWSNNAKSQCEKAVLARGLGDDATQVCTAVGQATDSYFMLHGKRTASKLKKTHQHLTKTSYGDVYHKAGTRLFNRLIGHCLKTEQRRKECGSSSRVLDLMEKDSIKGASFSAWITNVGIENTNPMYEVINSKSLTDEL